MVRCVGESGSEIRISSRRPEALRCLLRSSIASDAGLWLKSDDSAEALVATAKLNTCEWMFWQQSSSEQHNTEVVELSKKTCKD